MRVAMRSVISWTWEITPTLRPIAYSSLIEGWQVPAAASIAARIRELVRD